MTRPVLPSDIHSGRALAPGETVLWEGRPSWRGLALGAFHVRIVAAYFGAVAALGLVEVVRGHGPLAVALMPLVPGAATIAILCGLAALVARSTRYLVTSRRVILRHGLALPRSLSLPFSQIAGLAVSPRPGGRGDVALRLKGDGLVPFTKLWPHARPWCLARPEPMLRDIPDAGLVATRLSHALRAAEVPARHAPDGAAATHPQAA